MTQLIDLLTGAADRGPVSVFRSGDEEIVLVTGPSAVQHVLALRADNYVRRSSRMRFLLGDGVIPSSGEWWKHQRRILQSHFTARSVTRHETLMHEAAGAIGDLWTSSAALGQARDTAADMRRYSLDIIWRFLTGGPGTEADYAELDRVNAVFAALPAMPVGDPGADPAVAATIAAIHTVVDRAIDDADAHPGPWLLSTLLRTSDLSRSVIRDEVVNLVVAGYESTADTLSWIFPLLHEHPAELDRVRAGGVREVVSETLRLYPVAWTARRHAVADDVIDGHHVAAGTTVMVCPYLTHRIPSVWPSPSSFRPARFDGGRPVSPGAYIPFGIGPRACLGAQFTLREMPILLDHLLSKFTPRLHRMPTPVFGLTIHPDGPVMADLIPR